MSNSDIEEIENNDNIIEPIDDTNNIEENNLIEMSNNMQSVCVSQDNNNDENKGSDQQSEDNSEIENEDKDDIKELPVKLKIKPDALNHRNSLSIPQLNSKDSNLISEGKNNNSTIKITKLSNIDNLDNSSSLQDDDLMANINKDAVNISNEINKQELNIFNNYYDNKSESELKNYLREKNKLIISLSQSQEKYKTDLNGLIDGLNDAIDKSTAVLMKPNKNPQNMKSLEHVISLRQKELFNKKSQAKIYKQQLGILYTKANDRCSTEKINDMEEQIEKIKRENIELTKKSRGIKNSQILQSKELEVCNMNKKYPQKINSQTEEVKNLAAKKHEYFSKLINNKKSLTNLKNYLTRITKTFSDIQSNSKFITKGNENVMKQIEQEINGLIEELRPTEDEILERACEVNKAIITNNNNNYKTLIRNAHSKGYSNSNGSKSKSPNPSHTNLPKIISRSPGKARVNMYEYFSSRVENRSSLVKGKSSPSKNNKADLLGKKPKNFIEENNLSSDFLNDEESLLLDYENTYDSDYNELQKKREQFEKINLKIEKNRKEVEKLYDKKIKDLNNTLEHNQKKLKIMSQQNELLAVEIADLSKIIKLSLEESKLKKEIKDSESRIFRKNSQIPNNLIISTNAHNDVSETRNDILQELNNILIAEGEKATNKSKIGKKLNENVIEEENAEANSILVQNQENNENNENKNLKFPDISNVEIVIEEEMDMNRRDKKLNDIRSKYITIDNEINFSERNSIKI